MKSSCGLLQPEAAHNSGRKTTQASLWRPLEWAGSVSFMHIRAFVFSSLSTVAVVAALACDSGTSVPNEPTAQPSVGGTTATPFAFNAGAGVFIGTEGFATVTVKNIGSQTMVVSSVTYTGDSHIFLAPATGVSVTTADAGTFLTPPVDVPYSASLIVGLTCRPVTPTTVTGTLDIKSNAVNEPDISIVLSCLGVTPDAGP